MDTYDKFMTLIEILGAEQVLSEVYNYWGTYDVDKFVESVSTDYDIREEFEK